MQIRALVTVGWTVAAIVSAFLGGRLTPVLVFLAIAWGIFAVIVAGSYWLRYGSG
jgi:hypothetical protein